MSARFGLRALQRSRPFGGQQAINTTQRFAQRRTYESVSENAANIQQPKSRLATFWDSPVGPKTVHFWAPIMKWGVAIAGAADFARPASQLSISQNAALVATGAIWTRWCFVIKPRNVFLASVNFVLFCVGTAQVTRALLYQQSLKGNTLPEEAENAAKSEATILEKVVEDPKGAVKNLVNPK